MFLIGVLLLVIFNSSIILKCEILLWPKDLCNHFVLLGLVHPPSSSFFEKLFIKVEQSVNIFLKLIQLFLFVLCGYVHVGSNFLLQSLTLKLANRVGFLLFSVIVLCHLNYWSSFALIKCEHVNWCAPCVVLLICYFYCKVSST